jgi:hypothetical protein
MRLYSTVPTPGPNAAFVTSYFDHQPNPQPYADSTFYVGASHIPSAGFPTRYQSGAQADNQLGSPGRAYSASHPISVMFSTKYNQRAGAGNRGQQSSYPMENSTNPLFPASASQSLYPKPNTGSKTVQAGNAVGNIRPVSGEPSDSCTVSLFDLRSQSRAPISG